MSLQLAAQHLSSKGRGPDTTLVHMSRGELKSLNDLAMAHGGSLSINPHTGLPEAGFLESILPMVAGAALNAFAPGLGAMGAGLLTGAVTGMASGSLSKGLMAGLGAYGGAGLGEALATSGMQEAAGLSQAQSQLSALTPAQISEFQAATGPVTSGPVFEAQQAAQQAAQKVAAQQAAYQNAGFMDKLGTMGKGVTSLGTGQGWSNLAANAGGGMGLAKYGIAAASPILAETSQTKPPEIKEDTDMGQRYVYEPGVRQGPYTASPTGVEQQYFSPSYRKVSAAEAKNIFGFADGGAVDDAVKYGYDPLTQLFNKIESMPSDNQKVNEPSPISGRGGVNPQQAQVNAYFNSLSPEGLAAHQQSQANFINAVMPGATMVKGLKALTEGEAGSKISPMAYPSLAMSKLGDAAQTGVGFVLNKFAKPNPNPEKVQIVDMGDMLNSQQGEREGAVTVGDMSPADAVSLAIAQSLGEGSNGMGLGFGAPGAAYGNAGALGFGPSGMAGQTTASTTSPSAALAGLHGTGGGGMSAGFGAPGATSGNAGALGTGASGMAAGRGSSAGAGGAANGGLMAAYAAGGSHLGDYSDGGRLLRGPGDGVSDSIPAVIGKKQPARLADGEFVVPARIVSELGNGSTEAGARKLYAMMDRVQKARGRTVGKGKVAKNSRAERFLPA